MNIKFLSFFFEFNRIVLLFELIISLENESTFALCLNAKLKMQMDTQILGYQKWIQRVTMINRSEICPGWYKISK